MNRLATEPASRTGRRGPVYAPLAGSGAKGITCSSGTSPPGSGLDAGDWELTGIAGPEPHGG